MGHKLRISKRSNLPLYSRRQHEMRARKGNGATEIGSCHLWNHTPTLSYYHIMDYGHSYFRYPLKPQFCLTNVLSPFSTNMYINNLTIMIYEYKFSLANKTISIILSISLTILNLWRQLIFSITTFLSC